MITDLKPYPTYMDSGVEWLGLIPEHWEVLRGKVLFRCIDERSATGEEELLTVSSDRGVVPRKSTAVTMFKAESYVGHKLCWPGDLVINSLWAWSRGLGISQCHGIVSTAYGVYRLRHPMDVSAAYIDTLLRSEPFNWELRVRSKGIWISRLQLTDDAFLGAPFPVPPAGEQAEIGRFLDHADSRIRRYIRAKERLIELLEEQKQAIIHQAVTGQIDVRTGQPYPAYNASGVDGFAHVPAHWEVRRIKTMFRLRTEKSGVAHGRELLSIYTHIGVRPRKELEEKGNKASTTDDYWIVKKGDLILNKLLAWMGAVGVSHYDGVTSPAYDILMPIVDLASDYYHHLFRTRIYLAQFKKRSRGIMDMRLRLYFDQCGQIPVPVPTVGEQQAIVEFLNEIILETDHIINRTRRQIEMLREYRARLIADVVTGKLDVREAAVAMSEELDAPTDTIKLENTTEMPEDVAR